jgi:hypothetical protein
MQSLDVAELATWNMSASDANHVNSIQLLAGQRYSQYHRH